MNNQFLCKCILCICLLQSSFILLAQNKHIDLGLSVEWGECNIGAKKPWDTGLYFAWGETAPFGYMDTSNSNNYQHTGSFCKSRYNYYTYKWYYGKDSISPVITFFPFYSKYSIYDELKKKYYDDLRTLEDIDDAAKKHLGEKWRMPTKQEMQELMDNCIWTWAHYNNTLGYYVVSKKNGNSIFLPVTGFIVSDKTVNEDCGHYWSKNLSDEDLTAESLLIDETLYQITGRNRILGNAVRPVWDPH